MESLPLPSAEAFAPETATRAPVVMFKRRRRVDAAAAARPASGPGAEDRRPRVFVLPAAQAFTSAPAPASTDAASQPQPQPQPVARRRPRRDPQRMPGEVVHLVRAAPEAAADGSATPPVGEPGFDLGLDLDEGYPEVLAALQAVQRLLDEAASAARLQQALQPLS